MVDGMVRDETAMRAAIYARVSTVDQAHSGTSLATQIERCAGYVAAHGWIVVGEYADEGVSGTKASRPRLDAMRAAARTGDLDVVVVAKLDRFARSMHHLSVMIADLDDHDVKFVTVDGKFDTSTSQGRLMRNILGSFAEFERDMIIERTSSGLRKVAADGFWPGGSPPYGWRSDRSGPHTRLVVHDGEAETFRFAVDLLVDEGYSIAQVVARLNALGVVPARARKWQHTILRRLLERAPLSGEWIYARPRNGPKQAKGEPISVAVPAIITSERHAALQHALTRTALGSRVAAWRHFYTLGPRRLRSACGGTFYGIYRKDRDYRQYRCSKRLWRSEDRCDCHAIRADDIESAVWNALTELLHDSTRVIAIADAYLDNNATQFEPDHGSVAMLDTSIARSEGAITRITVDYAKAGLSAPSLNNALTELNNELADLRAQRAQVAAWTAKIESRSARTRRLRHFCYLSHRRLRDLTPIEQSNILALLDIEVTVTGWEPCAACNARGRLKGGRGGITCAVCKGSRHVPSLRVSGTLWDHVVDTLSTGPTPAAPNPVAQTQPSTGAIPFQLQVSLRSAGEGQRRKCTGPESCHAS